SSATSAPYAAAIAMVTTAASARSVPPAAASPTTADAARRRSAKRCPASTKASVSIASTAMNAAPAAAPASTAAARLGAAKARAGPATASAAGLRVGTGRLAVAVHEVPVDDVPERLDVVHARVAVVDVIGVLPHVAREQRRLARAQRIVGVGAVDDLERAVGAAREPRPSGAEQAHRGLGELVAELLEAAEGALDDLRDRAARRPAAVGRQALPVEAVVPRLRAVVEDASARLAHDLLERRGLERAARDELVQLVDVGPMVLVVVVF